MMKNKMGRKNKIMGIVSFGGKEVVFFLVICIF